MEVNGLLALVQNVPREGLWGLSRLGRNVMSGKQGSQGFMGTRKGRSAMCLSCLTCQAMSSNHPRLEGQWRPELWLTLPTPERASYSISSNTALKLPLPCAGFSQERSVKLFFKKKKNKPHFKITYAFQPQSAKWIMVLLFSSMSLAIFKPEYLKCSINRRKQAIYLRPLINTNQITTIHLF